MPRTARIESRWSMYHVTIRGANKQVIFESERDRLKFLKTLNRFKEESQVSVLAYCLMDNHVHLLLQADKADLSRYVKKIGDSYVIYVNRKYGKSGPLFEGRFGSKAIESELSLRRVIRYIHNNPTKAGLGPAEKYPWSSYDEFCGRTRYCDEQFIRDVIGGRSGFEEVMREQDAGDDEVATSRRRGFSDSDAILKVKSILDIDSPTIISEYPQDKRDECLRVLRRKGFSARQLARITGVGRGIVDKVVY